MKKILILSLLLSLFVGVAYAYHYNWRQTDWTCMRNCRAWGYMYQYCKSICSY